MGFHGLESKAGNFASSERKISIYFFPLSDSQLSLALVSNHSTQNLQTKHHITVCKQETKFSADDPVETLEGIQHSYLDCIWKEDAGILGTISSRVAPIHFLYIVV